MTLDRTGNHLGIPERHVARPANWESRVNRMLCLSVLAIGGGACNGHTRPQSAEQSTPEAAFVRKADALLRKSAFEFGVAAMHVETGVVAKVNGDRRYSMGSVFKVPLSLLVLSRADQGELSLDSTRHLTAADKRLGVSPIADAWPGDGPDMKIGDLVDAMLVNSDNSAADVLLDVVGGPPVVTRWLRQRAYTAIRLDRSEAEFVFSYYGVAVPPPKSEWTLGALRRSRDAIPPATQRSAARRFAEDIRDTGTPSELASLLGAIQMGRWLSPSSRERVLAGMRRTTTTPNRIRKLLPAGTETLHKSGTTATSIDGFTAGVCDIGIITLPRNEGHLAIAIFTKPGLVPVAEAEHTIAEIARLAYDVWAGK